jgi:hypothetical protein
VETEGAGSDEKPALSGLYTPTGDTLTSMLQSEVPNSPLLAMSGAE